MPTFSEILLPFMKQTSKSNIQQITLCIQFQHERVTHIKIQVRLPHSVKDQHNQQNSRHYYTLHHGIWHSVITATRDSVTCQPETCSSQQYPSKECHHSPSAIWSHHLNHAWQIVIKHTASYTITSQDMPAANVFTSKLVPKKLVQTFTERQAH